MTTQAQGQQGQGSGAAGQGESKGTEAKTFTQADLDAARAEGNSWKEKHSQLEGKFKGIDPDKWKTEQEELQTLRRSAAGNDPAKIQEVIDREKGELEKRYSGKYTEQEKRIEELQAEVKTLRVSNVGAQEAIAAGVNESELPLIQREIDAACDFQDGTIVVKDEKGNIRMSPSDPRKRMELKEFVKELEGRFPGCWKPKGQRGGKEQGNEGSAIPVDLSKMSQAEQRAYFEKNPKAADQIIGNARI